MSAKVIHQPVTQEEGELTRYLIEMLDQRNCVIIIITLCTLLATCYAFLATPVYQADVLIQLEEKKGNAILDSLNQVLPDSQPSSAPEISLIKSRMVLGKAVDDLHLQINVEKRYFPVIGKGLARLLGTPAGSVTVSRLSIPTTTETEPGQLTLTVLDDERYQIEYDGRKDTGRTGEMYSKERLLLFVDRMNAQPGEKFLVEHYDRLQAITRLQENLSVTDQGKDSGILELKLTGENKTRITQILDNISYHYLTQNIERQAAQDDKSLQFLKQELPHVRKQLDSAENTLNAYRQQKDSVDLSLEAKAVLDQVVNIDNQLNEITFREAEISKLYTREHPNYKALLEKKTTLQREKSRLNKQVSAMPATQQEVLRLSRDVESGRAVYMQLLNRQQELSIAKSSAIGNVRIIDSAVTAAKPVRPQKIILILAGMAAGLLVSIFVVMMRLFLHRGIESAAQLEQLGVEVYASIPKAERADPASGSASASDALLASRCPGDIAVEAIRSLRTRLHFQMLAARNNILLISGAIPEAGKTFVAANLAAVMAENGKKVLLIDADMRRGEGHKLLNVSAAPGLTEVLAADTPPTAARVTIQNEESQFDFIPRGAIPANPVKSLLSDTLPALLQWAEKEYDLVIIDTPPVLAVTDAVVIGQHAGSILLVAHYYRNSTSEIEASLQRFTPGSDAIIGCVLNRVSNNFRSYYASGYKHHTYAYTSKS